VGEGWIQTTIAARGTKNATGKAAGKNIYGIE
jgi:hypothetical protein